MNADAFDDPSGCIACGAMAGCCKEYPNCPGNPEFPWQPIETAPKDGTHILVCGANPPYTERWTFNQSPPAVVHYWSHDEPGFYLSSGDVGIRFTATHWCPLLQPPRTAAGDK